jgi:hypothetical protein
MVCHGAGATKHLRPLMNRVPRISTIGCVARNAGWRAVNAPKQ